ncbi:MAG: Cytochrome c biosis protein Ccs1 [Planctomycetota bacterium]
MRTTHERSTTPAAEPDSARPSANAALPWWRRGAAGALLDLFSSVKFGIWLMAILFVYSSIGSAGVVYPDLAGGASIFSAEGWAHDQMRQWRGLEMTEFEWFHWWPFDLMMALIAANITVTTLRRIPFKPVNYGVWMIHAGILVLIAGSWIYFGTKVEGDAPVARRKVVATLVSTAADGTERRETVDFLAAPGTRFSAGTGADRTDFEVTMVDPAWELLTGDDKGKRVYSVTVSVDRGGRRFMRQLLAGKPELNEDLVFTDDPEQPMKRAVKITGKPLIDETLVMDLDYEPQRWFYLRNELVKSWALYVRRPGETAWTERPIHGLPMYNDYIGDRSLVFDGEGAREIPLDPLDIRVPAVAADDPFPGIDFEVTGYLRYAFARSRFVEGPAGSARNPVAFLRIASDRGQSADYRLVANDPERAVADGGLLRIVDLRDEAGLDGILRQPTITVRIPGADIEVRELIRDVAAANPDAPFVEIKGSEMKGSATDGTAPYAYRVVNVRDGVPVAGRTVSLAIVEIRTPRGVFRRWVFDDPALTRDVLEEDAGDAHGAPKIADASIEVGYEPGGGTALVTLVHGPEVGRARLVAAIGAEPSVSDLALRTPLALPGGITVSLEELMPHAVLESKPLIVPRAQRQRDAMEIFSQILVAPEGGSAQWIPFNRWTFDSPEEVLRKSPYEPRRVRLADGREAEVLFGRQRLPLGTEVALEEFVLTSHVGGFTGEQGSIRNYTSMLRFRDPGDPAWSEPTPVRVNEPVEHDGLWYFQAQWDPPDAARAEGERASRGLNYTVLGVGNRNGVYTQLLGCVIAVAGMLYAFYVKPVLKRRRQAEVLESLARTRAAQGGA